VTLALETIAIAALVVGAIVLVLYFLGVGNDDDSGDVENGR
jgi:hypothetical protein